MSSKLNETLPIPSELPATLPLSYRAASGMMPTRRVPSVQSSTCSKSPIRLLLVDRDPVSRSLIRKAVTVQTDFHLIAELECEYDAMEKAAALRPDVVLIDVEASALDVAWLLSQTFHAVIVFLTMQRDFALEAFELGAADYLMKPLNRDRFEKTLDRIRQRVRHRSNAMSEPRKRITVTDRRKTHLLEPDQIEWISAAGDYTELHVNGATHLLREPFSALLSRLPADLFCRIHRSFAVNLNRITGFKTLRNQDLLVRLRDKTILRASRTFSDDLLEAISQQCV